MARAGTEHIHCESSGVERTISPIAAAYLYRVIQELVHNAFKHSSAWHIWVRLNWQPGKLIIEVEDDGTGFYKSEEIVSRLKKKHNTLRMRTQAIGASIQYEQGTKGLLARVVYPN
jgi:two-component system sensor histidine kinase DegS